MENLFGPINFSTLFNIALNVAIIIFFVLIILAVVGIAFVIIGFLIFLAYAIIAAPFEWIASFGKKAEKE